MTEEIRDQLFAGYFAVRKAVAAHGFSENFEEEPSFAMASSSSAYGAADAAVVVPPDVHAQEILQDYPRVLQVATGAGKTYTFVRNTRDSVKPLGIHPATLVTSGAVVMPITLGQGGSMATQQPPTTEDESVEEVIWRVGTTLSVPYRTKLVSRLSQLQTLVQEEESDGRGITVRSLQHFIQFLRACPTLRCPAVSVTPDRNIYASWKSGSGRVFSIHFLPDGNARFVVFCPNNKHSDKTIRLSGTATADMVMNIAAPHGVLSWASDERSVNPKF